MQCDLHLVFLPLPPRLVHTSKLSTFLSGMFLVSRATPIANHFYVKSKKQQMQRDFIRRLCRYSRMWWCLTRSMCCSVLQWVAASCSVLRCVAMCCSYDGAILCSILRCRVLQCVAECCSVMQCNAVWCSVLPCVAVCCSVLQLWGGAVTFDRRNPEWGPFLQKSSTSWGPFSWPCFQ